MTRPERDVRPDQRLDRVEHLVRQQEVEQSRVAVVRGVELVGELVALVGEVLVEDLLELLQPVFGQQLLARQQVSVLAEERDVSLADHVVTPFHLLTARLLLAGFLTCDSRP